MSRAVLDERLQASAEIVDRTLDGWPGVFSDSERRIVGHWGLSIAAANMSPHQLMIDGRRLSASCAWDTLFLPSLLGKPAEVESRSPGLAAATRGQDCITLSPVNWYISQPFRPLSMQRACQTTTN